MVEIEVYGLTWSVYGIDAAEFKARLWRTLTATWLLQRRS